MARPGTYEADSESGRLISADGERAQSSSTGSAASRIPGGGFKLSKRGKVVTLLFFLAVALIAITLGVVYAGKGDDDNAPPAPVGAPFSFQNTFDAKYKAVSVYPTWSSSSDPAAASSFTFARSSDGSILKYDAVTNSSSVLLLYSDFPSLNFFNYQLSPANPDLVLLQSNFSQVYRHSFKASYSLVNISSKQIAPDFPLSRPSIQLAAWAPRGEAIAFVEGNNVFILPQPSSPSPAAIAVTSSGTADGTIVHGIPDWVYEEEILGTNSALWWSPSGARLCFLSFNDTSVPVYTFPRYPLTPDSPYTELVSFRYPKPSFPNPSVKVSVFDTSSQSTIALNLTSPLVTDPSTQDFYVTQVQWVDEGSLLAVRQFNRAQNESLLLICNATAAFLAQTAAPCYPVVRQSSPSGWLETYSTSLHFLPGQDGASLVVLDIAEVNGYPQLVSYAVPFPLTLASPLASPTPITGDSWEIVSVDALKVSNASSSFVVYFTATGRQNGQPSDPTQHHVYSWDSASSTFTALSLVADQACLWNSASYDNQANYVLLTCSGPGVPYQTVRRLSSFTQDPVVIQQNDNLKAALASLGDFAPKREFFTIPLGNSIVYASRMVPPGFDESGATKYPVLVEVYGGPFSQKVTHTFSLGWQAFLASSLGYVIVSVDGRGTAGRGSAYRNAVYKDLGKFETTDQIDCAKYLQTLPWADAAKFAVWGWSYGGYMTTKIASAGSGVFKVAMAVAPVVEWELYDSVYTERYMGTPQDNALGYAESSVLKNVTNISKLHYLLVHGTGDDNVHFQNTAVLVSALTEAYVDFQVQFYTNRDHSLTGGGTTQHLYRLLTNFLQTGLGRSVLVA